MNFLLPRVVDVPCSCVNLPNGLPNRITRLSINVKHMLWSRDMDLGKGRCNMK